MNVLEHYVTEIIGEPYYDERVLTRVLPNTIILRKQEGEVRREVQRSNGKKV